MISPSEHAFAEDLSRWRGDLARALWADNVLTLKQVQQQVDSLLGRMLFLRIAEEGRPAEWHKLQRFDKSEVPDAVLAELYRPGHYGDNVFVAELLGRAYERGLADSLTLREGRPLLEKDPGLRRAQGVFYTPQAVVEAMVQWTLEPLLDGKVPSEVSTLRLLDPACGAGAFLVALYRSLLHWHLDWYVSHDPQSHCHGDGAVLTPLAQGGWRLRYAEKRRILTNNIFGLDLDGSALAVAERSLLLVLVERDGMTDSGLHPLNSLPILSTNLRCGNGLIGTDIGHGDAESPRRAERLSELNPFDWEDPESGFGTVLSAGGFDLVIGNPPYLSYSGRQAAPLADDVRAYFEEHYDFRGWPTAHGLFIQRAVHTLSRQLVSFIVPAQVAHLEGYSPTRKSIDESSALRQVHYWGDGVFQGVVTPSLSFIADKGHRGPVAIGSTERSPQPLKREEPGSPWKLNPGAAVLEKMCSDAWYLGKEVGDPGVHTGNCAKKLIHKTEDAQPGDLPVLEGKQISRYACADPKKVLRADYAPSGREYFRISTPARYTEAPFVIRQTAAHPIVGPRRHANHFRNSLLALYAAPAPVNTLYVVGLLNSSLLRFAYRALIQEAGQRAFPQVKVKSLRALPLKRIDPERPDERAAHDDIVAQVTTLLSLWELLEAECVEKATEVLRRQIAATDRAIDEAVFTLYGLSDDERAEVEALLAD